MSADATTAALVAACCLLALVAIKYAAYRVRYRFDSDDIEAARADAAKRSRAVKGGHATEQMAPLLGEFAERFDPADARFLGGPVDYVVFDGLAEGRIRGVFLVEVKTGGSRLNANEVRVRDAVDEGRVAYEVLRLG
ncbi:Holliday junction resolvase [Thermoleophilia bacterium SCSIO 60948]|nr:Holliday junction resolvase [Thermoleophilia bacterium SCSIO 60948]